MTDYKEKAIEELKHGGEGIYAENNPHAGTDYFDITDEVTQTLTSIEEQAKAEVVKQLELLSLNMGDEWSEGERYSAVQRLIHSLKDNQDTPDT